MDQLKDKYILLDTNVLIDTAKYSDEFRQFYEFLNKYNTKAVLDHSIKFEFLRGVQDLKKLKQYLSLLGLLLGHDRFELTADQEVLKVATYIAIFYGRNGYKNIEFTDCILAALMWRYSKGSENLYIATQNHKDFPPIFFNRIFIYTIDLKKEDNKIINVGFYQFRRDSFEKQLDRFLEGRNI